MSFKSFGYLKDLVLTILSALLLVVSFPRFDLGFLAWVSLVPLFLAISGKSLRYGFFLSTGCGIFFITGIFDWILEVPNYLLFHHAMLALYLGSYFGLFGLTFNFLGRCCGVSTALFAAPFVWVSLEYIRSNFSFLALPWGLLGHSQYQQTSVIQIASLAGTYSISFLIVIVNSALTTMITPLFNKIDRLIPSFVKPPVVKTNWALVIVAASCTLFSLVYGHLIISQPMIGKKIYVAVVQGNIEQKKKWDHRYAREIMQIYADLTLEDAKGPPDLPARSA
jgi:apolipoprotein N-acyltransferase